VPRFFVRPLLAIAVLLAVPSVLLADDTRPNVVLVLTDDLSTSDLGYLPSLRALTSERGKTFRMIVPAPRCAPSRASILTGQYPHNHDVVGNSPSNGGWASPSCCRAGWPDAATRRTTRASTSTATVTRPATSHRAGPTGRP
jgi:hypothetical protein